MSSFDKVTIVFAKAQHGVVPRLVGLRLPAARKKLERLKVKLTIRGRGAKIVRQRPLPSVAAAPGLPVTLWLGHG